MAFPGADYLIVSCEHGGNRMPPRFRKMFSARFLATHRGYDPGALVLARDFAAATGAPLFYSTVSRLLVELNRPLGHPQLFARDLPQATREALLRKHYFPYWRAVEAAVMKRKGPVLHLSCHSFTPKLRGERRRTDVGLLFDPARRAEARFCRLWRDTLMIQDPGLRVRYNDPYPGKFPSLVDELRKKLGPRYIGVQLEINQKFPRRGGPGWRRLRKALVASFGEARLQNPIQLLGRAAIGTGLPSKYP